MYGARMMTSQYSVRSNTDYRSSITFNDLDIWKDSQTNTDARAHTHTAHGWQWAWVAKKSTETVLWIHAKIIPINHLQLCSMPIELHWCSFVFQLERENQKRADRTSVRELITNLNNRPFFVQNWIKLTNKKAADKNKRLDESTCDETPSYKFWSLQKTGHQRTFAN